MKLRSNKQYSSSTSTSKKKKRTRRQDENENHNENGNDNVYDSTLCKRLPDEVWAKILKSVHKNSVTAFACVCKELRRVQQESGRKLKTDLTAGPWRNPSGIFETVVSHFARKGDDDFVSEDWFLWSYKSLTCSSEKSEKKKKIIIFNAAAFCGHLNILELLREQSGTKEVLFSYDTCNLAARGGHLEVLKYLHENGCPWNEDTCWHAAEGGHLEVLKYAHEKGCPWDENTCSSAAEESQLGGAEIRTREGLCLE